MGALRSASLALAAVPLAFAGCEEAERESPPSSVRSPSEPTLFLAGDGELTVVDADAGRAEVHELSVLAPGDPRDRILRRGNELVLWGGTRAWRGTRTSSRFESARRLTKFLQKWMFCCRSRRRFVSRGYVTFDEWKPNSRLLVFA